MNGLAEEYRSKRDRFESLLKRHFGHLAHWQRPAGGLFFWLTLRDRPTEPTTALLAEGIARGVAFMPGEPFWHDPANATPGIRLNFSFASDDENDEGLRRIASLFEPKPAREESAAPIRYGCGQSSREYVRPR